MTALLSWAKVSLSSGSSLSDEADDDMEEADEEEKEEEEEEDVFSFDGVFTNLSSCGPRFANMYS